MAKDGLVCIFFFVLFFPLIFWNFLYVQPILASQPQNQNREKKKKNPSCKKTRKNTNSTCRNKESSKYSLPRMHAKYLRRKKNKNERLQPYG